VILWLLERSTLEVAEWQALRMAEMLVEQCVLEEAVSIQDVESLC
jgi:hypothetical protein